MATVPATVDDPAAVPVIGFLAHVDTSPAVTGANVKPIIHRNYQGGDIVLPGDPSQVITVAQNPDAREAGRRRHHHDRRHDTARVGRQGGRGGDHDARRCPRWPIRRSRTARFAIGVHGRRRDRRGRRQLRRRRVRRRVRLHGRRRRARRDQPRDVGRATGDGHVSREERAPGHREGRDGERDPCVRRFRVAACPRDMLPETTEGRVGFVHPVHRASPDVERSQRQGAAP